MYFYLIQTILCCEIITLKEFFWESLSAQGGIRGIFYFQRRKIRTNQIQASGDFVL